MELIRNHVQRALSRLASQFRPAKNTQALIAGLAARWQTIEELINDVFHGTALPYAKGVQLDVIGVLLGEARLGRKDDEYRVALSYRVQRNHSNGEPWRLIQVYKFLTGAERVKYSETYPRTIWLEAWNPVVECEEELAIIGAMNRIRAGGFRLMLSRSAGAQAFRYAGTAPGLGYGAGLYADLLRTTCPVPPGPDPDPDPEPALVSDPFDGSQAEQWSIFSGEPVFAGGKFGGGFVFRDLGQRATVIKGAIGTPPSPVEFAALQFASSSDGEDGYNFGCQYNLWYLVKGPLHTPLDSYASAPQPGDTFEITIPDTPEEGEPVQPITIAINGVPRMATNDIEYRENTLLVFGVTGGAQLAVHPDEGVFLVK